MFRILLVVCLSLSFLCGCETANGSGDNPIVSPTNITNTVQDQAEPVLPQYTPWWVE